MKKNGFTLVELLGVIVILAILLVVSVPIILNVVNNSKKNLYINDVKTIVEEIEYIYENSMVEDTDVYKLYDFSQSDSDQIRALTFKGNKPSSGTIQINENAGQFESITITKLISSDGNWCANKSATSDEITVSKASDCN